MSEFPLLIEDKIKWYRFDQTLNKQTLYLYRLTEEEAILFETPDRKENWHCSGILYTMYRTETEKSTEGSLFAVIHQVNGVQHRLNGPAITYYYNNGKIYAETYRIWGKLFKENDKLYWTYYREDGTKETELFTSYVEKYGEDGTERIKFTPYELEYDRSGKIIYDSRLDSDSSSDDSSIK